jgi:hypothetical protein
MYVEKSVFVQHALLFGNSHQVCQTAFVCSTLALLLLAEYVFTKTLGGHKSFTSKTNHTSYCVHVLFGIQKSTSQAHLLLTVRYHIFEESMFLTIHMDAAIN